VDTENVGPSRAGPVGGKGEEVSEAGEPEQAVGPGVLAELELEVGQWAVLCGQGDTSSRGASDGLASPSAVEGADQSDGR
jgi:hypothetical protein